VKQCPKCDIKSTKFFPSARSSDGLQSYCIPCKKAYNKQHRKDNWKQIRNKEELWKINNKDKVLAQRKKDNHNWFKNNKEKALEHNKNFRRHNPTKYRAYMLKRKYKLTMEQYQEMLEAQNSGCAICGTLQSELDRTLAVDHDHLTGKIRGLLCSLCNSAIGSLKDSPKLCIVAANYLISEGVKKC
jgi:hypothetical protein